MNNLLTTSSVPDCACLDEEAAMDVPGETRLPSTTVVTFQEPVELL